MDKKTGLDKVGRSVKVLKIEKVEIVSFNVVLKYIKQRVAGGVKSLVV